MGFFIGLRRTYRQVEFHHGWCIGADDEAAAIAKVAGCTVIAHPGFSKGKPDDTTFRAMNEHYNDAVLPAKEFIARDHDIVDITECLVAAPHGEKELVRSGTWTTVRYARKKNRNIVMVWPHNRMSSEPAPVIPDDDDQLDLEIRRKRLSAGIKD